MRAVAWILVLGFALLGGPIASGELPTPCRSWIFPCGEGQHQCTTEQQYQSFISGPQPGCPVFYNPNGTAPPGECVLINGACNFTDNTVNCTTWLPGCDYQYRCGTFKEYEESPNYSCPNFGPVPLPDASCIPINDSCQWYNPCRLRRGFCNGSYQCGTLSEYWAMVYGPQPLCSPPAPGWEEPEAPGECILQEGECTWSECTSWLDWCQTSWQCGTDYEYRQFQASPIPGCPYPGDGYQPPQEPGECKFNVSLGTCQYRINTTCPNTKVYQECGSACPLTCDNYRDPPSFCTLQCVQGCFCPEGTVEYGEECVDTLQCPDNPCAYTDCLPNYICTVSEITGDAVCEPSCDLNQGGCLEEQICKIEEYDCYQQPCDNYKSLRCINPPAEDCFPNMSSCPDNSRCLALTTTEEPQCLESCYVNNGGCGDDQICVNEPEFDDDIRDCIVGLEPCSTVKCLDIDDLAGSSCPPGKEYSSCGSACSASCEVYITQEILACPAVCLMGCFCPPGLVAFRDRCVDAMECWILINDPPPIYPLPVRPNVILLDLTVTDTSQGKFRNTTYDFLTSVQQLLLNASYSGVSMSLYAAIETDQNDLKVVLEFTDYRNPDTTLDGDALTATIYENRDKLTLPVSEVSEVDVPTLPPDSDNPCAYTDCLANYICTVSEITGDAICEPSCDLNHGGCLEEQICKIEEYDCYQQPCDNYKSLRCINPPAEDCYPNMSSCSDNSRCLALTTTEEPQCLESCYVNNGGCGDDQICVNEPEFDNDRWDCRFGLEPCSTVKCLDIDVGGQCPPGKEYLECGTRCGDTCDLYVEQELITCAEYCYNGCFCPSGLITFRDRCVDPLECWSLINDPPPINPLPLPENTVLLDITVTGMNREEFNDTVSFRVTEYVRQLLASKGYTVLVSLFAAVEKEGFLEVVLRVSQESGRLDREEVVSIVRDNKDSLGVRVAEVSAVDVPTLPPSDDEDSNELSDTAIGGIIVGVLLFSTAAVVITLMVVYILISKRKLTKVAVTSVVDTNTKAMNEPTVTYSKLQEVARMENDYAEQY